MARSKAARLASISSGDFAPITRLVTAGWASGNYNAAVANGTPCRAQIACSWGTPGLPMKTEPNPIRVTDKPVRPTATVSSGESIGVLLKDE